MEIFTNPIASWPYLLVRGVIAVLFGLLALFLPGPTLGALVLLFAAYLVVDGVFAVLAGINAAREGGSWGWFALEAVLNIAAGAAAWMWPGLTVVVFVTLAGAWALLSGGVMLYGAFRFRLEHGRGWLVAGGVVSVLWGLLLFAFPIAGAVVMTLWLGGYALVFGIALIALALRLRRAARILRPA